MMDHPNIAKVLDAGATETGRPYFAMELVRGIKITEYCDQHNLCTRERLELFVKVCHAIQHAHQKGIIHRDIKPSNVLVTVNDGVPVAKVIDFGIAKATHGELTDKTVYTQFQQFIGTPAYMSPEQAEMTSLDIDTRSDIYALGVLLYELLTGKTPFEQKELLEAGLDGMRRMIREQEPQRPSTRVSSLQAIERTTTAKRRGLDAPKLVSLLRGDLDWIVMKCLEKDRTRRYETANGLAREIERFLNNEPVAARPPSAVYRFQKLVRRNKLAVAAVCSVSTALLLGLGLLTSLWLKEREANRMRAMMKFFNDTQILRTSLPKSYVGSSPDSTNVIAELVLPGDPRLNGKTYEQWAAAWLQWSLQMPLTNAAGAIHPTHDSSRFDVSAGQSSNVWFLAAPFNKVRRSCVIPSGKALFFPIFNVYISSLEPPPFYGRTSMDQAGNALYFANHILNPFCELDGRPILNLDDLRVLSPQANISVPTPWLQGDVGGKGTATVAGYFVFLSPLAPGEHTLHFGGIIRLKYPQDLVDVHESIDITYHIKVVDSAETTSLGQK
jgi:serine/threonine protein kinase